MRTQEVRCFADALDIDPDDIEVLDLLNQWPSAAQLARHDAVFIGGSGHYSAVGKEPWLDFALDVMRLIHDQKKPTFASCWGFQAFSRAMGGQVVKDSDMAEVGTNRVTLTDVGRNDPIFAPSGESFLAPMGHEYSVTRIPADAILLASTQRCPNQALRFVDRPIYATQFHPELTTDRLLERIRIYPEYIERITGIAYDDFVKDCHSVAQANAILPRFANHVLG